MTAALRRNRALRSILGLSLFMFGTQSVQANLFTYTLSKPAYQSLPAQQASFQFDDQATPIGKPTGIPVKCSISSCSDPGESRLYHIQNLTIGGVTYPEGFAKITTYSGNAGDYGSIELSQDLNTPLQSYGFENLNFGASSYLAGVSSGSPVRLGSSNPSLGTLVVAEVHSGTNGSTPSDVQVYSAMLDYVKAQFAYNGAVYSAFQELGLSAEAMGKLTDSYGKLSKAELSLVQNLQAKITPL